MNRVAANDEGAAGERTPLAIICGAGTLPFAVAESVTRSGRNVFLFGLRGFADDRAIEKFPHVWMGLGQFGAFVRGARERGCRDVVLIGSALRPRLSQLGLDIAALRHLPQVIAAFRGGDDHLLASLARIFEQNGFRMLGAHDVAPEILVPLGNLGHHGPSGRDHKDIARGLALLGAIGPYDVGQAVVVAAGHVLGVEAAEGTDGLLDRIAELRRLGRVSTPVQVGVLVKAPKPGQDRRFDLPAIGPATIRGAVEAGLAGVAVVAGSTIIAQADAVIREADRAGIFAYGVAAEALPE